MSLYIRYPSNGGGSGGTVTSVGLADGSTKPIFTVSGSPVTGSGTLTLTLQNQNANTVFAGPASGSAAQPTFRPLVANDIPSLSYVSSVTASTPLFSSGGLNPNLTIQVANTSQSGYLSSTDWNTFNNKQASGNYITALTGDATASGPGSAALTLATVNSNIGSFGSSTSIPSFTVNAKGLITAASGNAVIAPASTLSGTTLNSSVVSSSLTSVGTITSGTWNGTTIAIANGGTGQTSASAAFNALSPITSTGDLIVGNGVNSATRLGIGSSNQVLTVSGGTAVWANPATSGTVTSVALSDSSTSPIYTVSGSPVTSSGTLALTLKTQSANTVFAGPSSGSAAQPTFRPLVANDIPSLSYVSSVTASTPLFSSGGLNPNLTIQVANTSQSGYLSSTDWNTFNNKQASGNYITALTGDATASGPGSAALTLATVNSNTGSFGSSTSIPSFTVNAKGLITAASGNAVVAPAGTLSGTTLNSSVVSSSLTSVGTITSGTWNGTTIAIANGGTGQTSASAAFNALSPITSTGDLIIGTGTNTASRLAIGSNGTVLTSNGTTVSWQSAGTPSFSGLTTNGVMYATSSSNITSASAGTSGQILTSNGSGSAPAMTTLPGNTSVLKAVTTQIFYQNNYYTFTITQASPSWAAGDQYTNNSSTFTTVYAETISGATTLVAYRSIGSNAPSSSGTLTRSSGSGSATLTYSSVAANGTYFLPVSPSPIYLKVTAVGGGGGGGNNGGGSSSGGAGGGGGGATAIKFLSSLSSSYVFSVAAGAAANGTASASSFGTNLCTAGGGGGGANAGTSTNGAAGGVGGVANYGDLQFVGGAGSPGGVTVSGVAYGCGGNGGSSTLGGGSMGSAAAGGGSGTGGGNYGGGGGGANGNTGSGGVGASGIVIVEEHYQ
jgi:hypothetical protein